ncbi:glutathione S-transferase [Yersinia intermedia]|uniref:glutathione S-transferase n=1 Tax=Yersinia intermedia TaxID=631 RepID=UPI0005E3BEA1|nr:glutathione S-transferase [Yersinia intermedia]MCB5314071.1 glutathione S-transferase [Yersinia intermedia]MCB5328126.1 glutathione S-transferase [Yersinia intermedia]UNK24878.1 glutathione S-transferase [Yersinia intermedia]CNB41491.1 putative glutathione S-transferase-family protein [Yersinia intermedia]CRE71253.1 putative glutathione S-transferase-family protein [Yersinia intermedia]
MLTVWGRNNSTNVKKVLWCLEELGISYQRIDVGGQYGKLNDPLYRSMNPNGLIPCLQDDDFILWESNTIVRYLAAQYGDGTLYLPDARLRASAEKWMDWATSSMAEPFKAVFIGLVRTPPEQQDKVKIAQGMTQLNTLMAIADQALEKQAYLSGDKFGIGDIPLGCLAYAWFNLSIERPPLPNVERWYQRVSQRAAFQKVIDIGLS